VVPFLLALIIYYFLQPATHRLVLQRSCIARPRPPSLAAASSLLLLICAALLFPWVSSHAVSWQASMARYIEGGSLLLQKTMDGLEVQFDFLERASLSRNVSEQIAAFTETFAQRYLADFVVTLADLAASAAPGTLPRLLLPARRAPLHPSSSPTPYRTPFSSAPSI
jgi:predicted PurR-regulated permease PerM